MSSETFTIDQVKLLEESVLCMSREASRKLQESERVPVQSSTIRTQMQESRNELSKQLDDLALIRAKLITQRHYLFNMANAETAEETPAAEEPQTE